MYRKIRGRYEAPRVYQAVPDRPICYSQEKGEGEKLT
jgi:hypothetical protein